MLEFYYNFLDYYLHREDFEILEMDTDSNYLGITAENLEDLIKSELRERNKHNWFVTSLAPQGKRTPGLIKVEFEGDKMIGLCSKLYYTELFANENSKDILCFTFYEFSNFIGFNLNSVELPIQKDCCI